MRSRSLLALSLPALAAIIAACSSSSSPATPDGGTKDAGSGTGTGTAVHTGTTTGTHTGTTTGTVTGTTTGTVTGTTTGTVTGTTTGTVTGTTTGTTTGTSSSSAAPGKLLAKGMMSVLGVTDEDEIIYQDFMTGALSASDIDGNVTLLIASMPDGGVPPQPMGVAGHFVLFLTDYTYNSTSGQIYKGTLSIWSKTLGKVVQVATDSSGFLNVAADSSAIAFTEGANTDGTIGNIAIVGSDGVTGKKDILTNVVTDLSSAKCAPLPVFDKGFAVVTSCAVIDGGDGAPQIASFDGSNAWAEKVLVTNAGPSSPYVSATFAINFTVDSVGDNVLTIDSTGKLFSQGITSTTQTALTPFGTPSGGFQTFYLSTGSTFALWSDTTGALQKAAYATPTSAPTIDGTPIAAANTVIGQNAVSPDQNWEIDFNSVATDSYPTSLNLRNLSTGASTALISAGNTEASTFGAANAFTPDSTYAVFTTNVWQPPHSQGTVGTLKTVEVATGNINTLVAGAQATVWSAGVLSGTALVYNQNYTPVTATLPGGYTIPNGSATADIYAADAKTAAQGTLVVTGADAPLDGAFLTTKDKKHLFYSVSQLAATDGGTVGVAPGDGVYVVALP